jgi:hypothetical protein
MCAGRRKDDATGKLVAGVVLVAVGSVFLLDRLNLVQGFGFGELWPLIVIAVGINQVLRPARPDGSREGTWVLAVGVWLLINEVGLVEYHESWPLLLIAFGVGQVWQSIRERQRARPGEE